MEFAPSSLFSSASSSSSACSAISRASLPARRARQTRRSDRRGTRAGRPAARRGDCIAGGLREEEVEAEANAAAIVAEARAQAEVLAKEAVERMADFVAAAPAGGSEDRARRIAGRAKCAPPPPISPPRRRKSCSGRDQARRGPSSRRAKSPRSKTAELTASATAATLDPRRRPPHGCQVLSPSCESAMKRIFLCLAALFVFAATAQAAGIIVPAKSAITVDRVCRCDDSGLLSTISDRFAQRKGILEFDDPPPGSTHREIGYRANGVAYIPRRYCVARTVDGDGKFRPVIYDIGEDLGMIGWATASNGASSASTAITPRTVLQRVEAVRHALRRPDDPRPLLGSLCVSSWLRRARRCNLGPRAADSFDYYVFSCRGRRLLRDRRRSQQPAQCAPGAGEASSSTPVPDSAYGPNPKIAGRIRLRRGARTDQRRLPDEGLARYEYRKHGSCSGLDPQPIRRGKDAARRDLRPGSAESAARRGEDLAAR